MTALVVLVLALAGALVLPTDGQHVKNQDCPTAKALAGGAPPGPGAILNKNFTSDLLVRLGVDTGGQLNVLVDPSQGYPTPPNAVGLRAVTPDGEFTATEQGCACEGWGASAYGASSGTRHVVYYNNAAGSLPGIADTFSQAGETVTAEAVTAGFRITQKYAPSDVDGVFLITVDITNIGTEALRDVRYRKNMDWDIDPTAYDEIVTIDWYCPNGPGTCPKPLFLETFSDNGFASSDPESDAGFLNEPPNTRFVKAGPSDHGGCFTFNFKGLAPGESRSFTIFYGARRTALSADDAILASGMELWSIGYNSLGNADYGPAVFFFGFAGIGCSSTGVSLTGKTSRKAVRVVRSKPTGPTVRYTATLVNNKNNKPFEQAGLVVQLPASTTYVKGTVSPRPRVPGGNKHNNTLTTPVYDTTANTVTWPDVPLAGGKKRKYTVVVKVDPSTAVTPLVFQAACPNCPTVTTTSSVKVREKGW